MLKRIFYPKNEGVFFLSIVGIQFLGFRLMLWLQNTLYPAPARGFTTQISSDNAYLRSMIHRSELINYRAQLVIQASGKGIFLLILVIYSVFVVIRLKKDGLKWGNVVIYTFSFWLLLLFSSVYNFFLAPIGAWD